MRTGSGLPKRGLPYFFYLLRVALSGGVPEAERVELIRIAPVRNRSSTEVVPPTRYLGEADIASVTQARRAGVWIEERDGKRYLAVGVTQQPDDLALDAWLRFGDQLYPLDGWHDVDLTTNTVYLRGDESVNELIRRDPALGKTQRVDLILQPDIDYAKSALTRQLWLGEWIFEDVPLHAKAVSGELYLRSDGTLYVEGPGGWDLAEDSPSHPKNILDTSGDMPTLVPAKATPIPPE